VQRFFSAFKKCPKLFPETRQFDSERINIGPNLPTGSNEFLQLKDTVSQLIPWRKGPFNLFGIEIDAEWRADRKWNRLKPLEACFNNKKIIDIGCNSGYYMFRMLPLRPKLVIGIDPSDLYFFQFHLINQFIHPSPLHYLAIGIEDTEPFKKWFDTVLCMGVLYHQRSPIDALRRLRELTHPKGTVILETLIIDDPGDFAITPKSAYAKMPNVYFIPTIECLKTWINRAGFKTVEVIDITRTTTQEQRRTEWVNTESLSDFLSPSDPKFTVEGYPAPTRAIIACRR
ncbi:tRNA 5-methoxyuridine(34)/uridine 5-oxyacetic acid(34) synthase CmoB, partial [bacterium]|nr:tRNA 5-methoxyuridine(34)/uridine 5-oxyacetic acid(34) synthase CmoB [bacterium]